MDFRDVWRKIGELEQQTFRTDHGVEFSYRFHKTYIVVSPGEISVPRTNFEKVLKRMQQAQQGQPIPLQGQRFITAILGALGIGKQSDQKT